jgi:hypothetical protein
VYFRSPSGNFMDHFVAQAAESSQKYFSFQRTLVMPGDVAVGTYEVAMFQCSSKAGLIQVCLGSDSGLIWV